MSAIIAFGTAVPAHKRQQENSADLIATILNLNPRQKKLLHSIYKKTKIEQRYSVIDDYLKTPGKFKFFPNNLSKEFPTTEERMKIYKDNALPLALSAINQCFKNINAFSKQEITHIITVSCTGMYAPGLDIEIIQNLKLNSSVKRTCINFMGCYGAFNALKIADAFCKTDMNAKVLIVCVELCTIHFQKNSSLDSMISSAIFSDGAAAVIIENPTKNKQKYLSLDHFYCDLIPQTSQEMAWDIGNHGFDITLSSYIPEIISSGISSFFNKLTSIAQLKNKKIDFYAIHPGGLKILQACEMSLDITPDDNKFSYFVMKKFGNMSSATIFFVLKEIWDGLSQENSNKKIFSCAFGPGLTLESMLLTTHIRD